MMLNPELLENYATGIHSVTDINESLKDEAKEGVIFCLKQVNHDTEEKSCEFFISILLGLC